MFVKIRNVVNNKVGRDSVTKIPFSQCLQTKLGSRTRNKFSLRSHNQEFNANLVRSTFDQQLALVDDKMAREMAQKGYAVEYLLGQGSFGAVYKARKLNHETGERTPVAMKVIGGLYKYHVAGRRHESETELLELFDHPNIVKVYEVFKEKNKKRQTNLIEKRVFILMELADSDLKRLIITRGAIPETEVKHYMIDCLNGLHYLHSQKVAHKNIKPQNILLFGSIAKLADYSLVREVRVDAASLTGVGTRNYRALECMLESGIIEDCFKADIWSLGITLYQCLLGARPKWHPERASRKGQTRRLADGKEDLQFFMKEYRKLISGIVKCPKSPEAKLLMHSMLEFDPHLRPSCEAIKNLPWITGGRSRITNKRGYPVRHASVRTKIGTVV